MKRFVLILAALPAFAQQASFVARTGAVTLVAATTAATIQQPTPISGVPAEQIQLIRAVVRCPAACVITQRQNDTTAATATAGTVSGLDPTSGASFLVTFWTASNASGGTTVGSTTLDAAGTIVLDLSAITFGGGGTKTNYTIAVSSVTGDVYIDIYGKRIS